MRTSILGEVQLSWNSTSSLWLMFLEEREMSFPSTSSLNSPHWESRLGALVCWLFSKFLSTWLTSMLIVSLSYLLQTMWNLSPFHPFSAFSIIPSIITSSQQMIKPFCWIKASDWWSAKFQGQIRILIPSGSSFLLLSVVYIHWCSAVCLDVNLQYFHLNLKFSRTRVILFLLFPHS